MERREKLIVYLDTHIIIWLFNREFGKLSKEVKTKINTAELYISPMVMLETQYMLEIGRITASFTEIYQELHKKINVNISSVPFSRIALEAMEVAWTRDPFDRIIVAEAILENAYLVTADENILNNYEKAII